MSRSLIRRRFVRLGASAAALLLAAALAGFVRISFSPGSAPFSWASVPVTFVIQSAGSDDVPDASDATAIRLAAATWEKLPQSAIDFTEDTAADATRTDFDAQDIHLVLWDESGDSGQFPPGSGIVALTPILASTSNGQIFDADIVFNGSLPFSTRPTAGRFDVQSVATHEFGHFIGLDHGCGPFATMHSTVVAGSTSVRSLSRDEEAAAVTIYPAGAGRGQITGSVVRQGVGGLGFAHVVAIDATTGEVGATAVTDAAGGYTIQGLLPGSYTVYAEPLDGPFVLADTIGLTGQPAPSFPTTVSPSAVSVSAGGSASATITVVAGDAVLNAAGASGTPVTAGGPPATLIVNGTGMGTVTQAVVTGTGVTATSVEPLAGTLVRVTLVATAGAPRGVRSIRLQNGSGALVFVTAGVDVVDPTPTITAVDPDVLPAQGGTLVTIDGTNFVDGCDVVIGGQLATAVQLFSPTQLRCAAPPSPGVTTPVDVVVIRPDGIETRALSVVNYEANPIPTSIDPNVASTQGGTLHTIYGSGFATGVTVRIGTSQAQVLNVTPTAIQVAAPAQPAGPASVVVTAGERSGSVPGGMTYVNGVPPFISTFTPGTSPTSGGVLVTITGTGFASNAQVRFGAVDAQGVSVVSDTTITCTAPAQAAGGVPVRVTNPTTGLASVSLTLFTYGDTVAAGGGGGGGGSSGCALSAAPATGSPASSLLGLGLVAVALVGARRRRA